MIFEFEKVPSINTLREHVLPYLNNPDETLYFLINCQVNVINAANSILLKLLQDNKIREAANFSKLFLHYFFLCK